MIRRVRTMPEQKVKSMLAHEVDPRKSVLTLDLELIDSVTAIDQEKRSVSILFLSATLYMPVESPIISYTSNEVYTCIMQNYM